MVGYLNKGDGFIGAAPTLVTPTFERIAADTTIRLTDISVGGYTLGEGEAPFTLQPMTISGVGKEINIGTEESPEIVAYKFYWYDIGTDYPAGWYDEDGNSLADKTLNKLGVCQDEITFAPGQGIMAYQSPDYPDARIVFAGAVKTTTAVYADFVPAAPTIVGNPFPVNRSLAQIWVDGYTHGEGEAPITVQPMTISGIGKEINIGTEEDPDIVAYKFYWYDIGTDYPAGWYDEDGNSLADKSLNKLGVDEDEIIFAPGDAYMVYQSPDYPEANINFPAPEGL